MICNAAYTIAENAPAAAGIYRLRLNGPAPAFTAPGQFAALSLAGFFLRRPFSVSAWDNEGFSLCYKIAGEGTQALSKMKSGEALEVMTGLGNGFDIAKSSAPLLIGGGTGASPLYGLAKALLQKSVTPAVALGFENAAAAILLADFRALGIEPTVATLDGSMGHKGLITEAVGDIKYDYFYACGPTGLLRALDKGAAAPGEFSLEARLGCGFGACMGCTVITAAGPRRVCRDGPVFKRGELVW